MIGPLLIYDHLCPKDTAITERAPGGMVLGGQPRMLFQNWTIALQLSFGYSVAEEMVNLPANFKYWCKVQDTGKLFIATGL